MSSLDTARRAAIVPHRVARWLLALALCLGASTQSGCRSKREERIDLTRFIEVDPGRSVVDLSKGSAKLRVSVRNVSHLELKKLQLLVKSQAGSATVQPKEFAAILPGSREVFRVDLTRNPKAPKKRFALQLTIRAKGLPVDGGIDLLADLRGPQKGGWIDVGQVKIVHRKSSRTSYYLLGLLPLLFFVGFFLHRLSRKRKPRNKR